ncbi:hypothetical protein SAMN05216215_10874 [Saccharopolyspora shandongensis]|uniref:Uncharacterized protein n=1 Tax=Saccharopolyspora shandongensis TaxID=418495 RepID=A0A1H3TM76_9PSEU|nr:hypothetical protein [Saccharopolyspora shandongensis]SDZ51097.1 hypothetical protein SAMN05216215_10874 [Saccharopolyspora shandongensis]
MSEVVLLTTLALDWFGGLPVPPGVGDNTGWAPPAVWDTETGGLVDETGAPVIPTDPPPSAYPPEVVVIQPPIVDEPAPTDPETGA